MKKLILLFFSFFILWIENTFSAEILVKQNTNFKWTLQFYWIDSNYDTNLWYFIWSNNASFDINWNLADWNTNKIQWNYSLIDDENAYYLLSTYPSSPYNYLELSIIDKYTWLRYYSYDLWSWTTQRNLSFFKINWYTIFSIWNQWKYYDPWNVELWISPWIKNYTWIVSSNPLITNKKIYSWVKWSNIYWYLDWSNLILTWFQEIWWVIWTINETYSIPDIPIHTKSTLHYTRDWQFTISYYDSVTKQTQIKLFNYSTNTWSQIDNKYVLFYNQNTQKWFTISDMDIIDYSFDLYWRPIVIAKYDSNISDYIKYYQKTDNHLYTNWEPLHIIYANPNIQDDEDTEDNNITLTWSLNLLSNFFKTPDQLLEDQINSYIPNINSVLNTDSFKNFDTTWSGMITITNWVLNNISLIPWSTDKCNLINKDTLIFLYYSNWTIWLNFSLQQFAVLDNFIWVILDKAIWVFVWPVNSIISVVSIITPFTTEPKEYCLMWRVYTLESHSMFTWTDDYQEFTFLDYIVLMALSLITFKVLQKRPVEDTSRSISSYSYSESLNPNKKR